MLNTSCISSACTARATASRARGRRARSDREGDTDQFSEEVCRRDPRDYLSHRRQGGTRSKRRTRRSSLLQIDIRAHVGDRGSVFYGVERKDELSIENHRTQVQIIRLCVPSLQLGDSNNNAERKEIARGRQNRAKKEATLTAILRTLWEPMVHGGNGVKNDTYSCKYLASIPLIPRGGPAVSFMNCLAGEGFFTRVFREELCAVIVALSGSSKGRERAISGDRFAASIHSERSCPRLCR